MAIIIGEIIFPKNIPNLNQSLFKGVRIFELIRPSIKKIIDITNDQILISLPLSNGQNDIIKKTIKKTTPKLLFDPIFGFIFNFYNFLYLVVFQEY